MRYLVCFKVVRDLDSVIESDWESAGGDEFEIDYTKKIWNCFDEAALETALQLKDEARRRGQGCEVHAVTISELEISDFVNRLFAVGMDSISVIRPDRENLRFRPDIVARVLAKYARGQGGFDAILTGMQASPGDNGQTAALLSQELDMHLVSAVTDLEMTEKGLRVTQDLGLLKRCMTVVQPAVYAMGNARHAYLRVATLREKRAAASKNANLLDWGSLEIASHISSEAAQPCALTPRQSGRICTEISGDSPEMAAEKLFEYGLKGALRE